MNPLKTPNKKAGAMGIVLASASLLTMIASHEGYKDKPYHDSGGILTVCNGITGNGVIAGKTYTPQECNALLIQRVSTAGDGILNCINVQINENQYNAFVDLAYNIGVSGFCRSSIVTYLNKGDYISACNRMLAFDRANGEVLLGLQRRRVNENKLCLTPMKP